MAFLNDPKFLKTLHVSPRLNAVYLSNPKVACSTVKLALQRAEAGDPDWVPKRSVHDHNGSPLLTWPDLTMETWQAATRGKLLFSFVRNPFDRLRSAYLNRIVRRQNQGIHRTRAGFDPNYVPNFREFVLKICTIDPRRHDAHWRPQSLNLSNGRVTLDFLGRLETFQADWAKLAERLGLPTELERAGKETTKEAKSELIIDSEMQLAIARVYALDFEAYGYDPEVVPEPR